MSLVEILVASLVIGIAIVGVSLIFGTGSALVANTGDDRVASGLAQQEIEQRRTAGFAATSALVGPGQVAPETRSFGAKSFTRETCIQYVPDDGSNTPAYTPDCPNVNAGPPPPNTLRITVTVTPVPTADANGQYLQAEPVTLQAWLVP